ncbi:DUF1064 domain-containing protein [Aeromonas veronii]|uniref:DUF1064 domain-containing protein n=1 Tax=Aeromonas veronii TaxID=654 RepID=UPI003D19B3EC
MTPYSGKSGAGQRVKVRARPQPIPGSMNKTEQAYADHLRRLMLAGEVISYEFEPLKLRLADKTFYTPDFMVVRKDGLIELHEVKGFWEDDARVKIKVAAKQHWMFTFVGVMRKGANWSLEAF